MQGLDIFLIAGYALRPRTSGSVMEGMMLRNRVFSSLLGMACLWTMLGCQVQGGSGTGFGAGAKAYDLTQTFPPVPKSTVVVTERPYAGNGVQFGKINGWDNPFLRPPSKTKMFDIMQTEAARVGAHIVADVKSDAVPLMGIMEAQGALIRIPDQ